AAYLINPAMEVTISVVASELVSLFVSFLMSKYHSSSHAQSEEKVVDRLQHLLIRVGTMVKEADSQYISNSRMMMQLKMLPEDTVCLIPRGTESSKTLQASTRLAATAHLAAVCI
uniref:Uncharacterized protein n=1 Tax=Aegilops tauschii subsp. strangulata TaxID=200361 RepID=A0A453GIH1_AEGTS